MERTDARWRLGGPSRAAAREIGLILAAVGVLAAVPAFVGLVADGVPVFGAFAATALLGTASGGTLMSFGGGRPFAAGPFGRDVGLSLIAAGWLLATLLGALPFWLVGRFAVDPATDPAAATFADPLACWFESTSGLTSTGLTMTCDPATLPQALLVWRSLTQWIGGLGILYLAVLLAGQGERSRGEREDELDQETDDDGLDHDDQAPVGSIWRIYAAFTAVLVIAFAAAGLSWHDACHFGLTTICTGGFAVTADSFASVPTAARWVALVGMVVGSVSFHVHCLFWLRGRIGEALRDRQTLALLGLILLGAGAFVAAVAVADEPPGWTLTDAVFQWSTALCTCGLSTVDLSTAGPAPLLPLVAAMFVGGALGSTVGGIKIRRLATLAAATVGAADRDRLGHALRLTAVFGASLAVGTVLLSLTAPAYGPVQCLFEAASALGTVGLSVGISSPELAPAGKLTLVLLMWAGRLEVVAALALIGRTLRTVARGQDCQ